MNDEEFREYLRTQIEQADRMYRGGSFRNRDFAELSHTIVELVRGSDFGKQPAESTLDLGLEDMTKSPILDSGFDGVIIQLLGMANQCLERYGNVSVAPYSRGIATKTAKLTFTPK